MFAVKAYDAVTGTFEAYDAVRAYDDVFALEAYDAVPDSDPVNDGAVTLPDILTVNTVLPLFFNCRISPVELDCAC